MSVAVSSGGEGYNDGRKSASSSSSSSMRRSSSSSVVLNVETIRLHASSMVARMMSRVSVDTLRPLPMFVGVVTTAQQQHNNSPNNKQLCFAGGAYTPPIRKFDKASLEKVKSRVSLNFAFFLSNYVLVASMVGLVVALMHPGMVSQYGETLLRVLSFAYVQSTLVPFGSHTPAISNPLTWQLFFVGICYGLWTFHAFLIRNELELFGIRVHSLLSIQQRFYLNFAITTVVVLWKCLKPALIFVMLSALLISTHAFLRDPKHIEASMSMDAAAAASSDTGSALSPSGSTVMLLRGNSHKTDHSTEDDDYYDDEEANMGSSAGSSGSEKGAVLVDRPTATTSSSSSDGTGMTKRRGDVI
jgi:hypothetical protein